jgi:hypothetical protein
MSDLDREVLLANFREKARAFCDHATNQGAGVYVKDAVYQEITEGRDSGPGYSSCGDLAHALLQHLGARAPWVNHGTQWKSGMNVNRLARLPVGNLRRCPLARAPKPGEQFHSGDIVVIWKEGGNANDAHVFVVDIHGPGSISSWDYGQGGMQRESWGRFPNQLEGVHKERRIVSQIPIILSRTPLRTVDVPLLDCGKAGLKAIQSVISLADLLGWLHPIQGVAE